MSKPAYALSLVLVSMYACSSAEHAPSAPPQAGAPGDAGSEPDGFPGLAVPSDGFQVRSIGTEIQPGEDVEYCEVARLPGAESDHYFAKSFEFANNIGSHHLIVSAAAPGSAVEAKLKALGVGERVPCFSAENQFGNDAFVGVGGTQQPYNAVALPEGVGREYYGGQLLVFDYHYLNTREEPIPARSAVNFHLTDAASVEHIARGFSFSNVTIATAPVAHASFTGECHFRSDVMLSGLTRHTHRWGRDYSVWFSGGPRDGEEIWTSHDWQHETIYNFDEPIRMHAGEGLRFRCDFENDTARTLRYGVSASDEMCILFGTIWEAEQGELLGDQNCVITWRDADGVGHPANEAGGFPAPSQGEKSACLAKAEDTACARCRCEACATPAIQCAVNGECESIVDCYRACPMGSDCNAACQTAIDEHSSGLGLLQQMTSCFDSRCASDCN